jgi:serine/threonine protein kinase
LSTLLTALFIFTEGSVVCASCSEEKRPTRLICISGLIFCGVYCVHCSSNVAQISPEIWSPLYKNFAEILSGDIDFVAYETLSFIYDGERKVVNFKKLRVKPGTEIEMTLKYTVFTKFKNYFQGMVMEWAPRLSASHKHLYRIFFQRDGKPTNNLCFVNDLIVKISDFGDSKVMQKFLSLIEGMAQHSPPQMIGMLLKYVLSVGLICQDQISILKIKNNLKQEQNTPALMSRALSDKSHCPRSFRKKFSMTTSRNSVTFQSYGIIVDSLAIQQDFNFCPTNPTRSPMMGESESVSTKVKGN